MRKILCGVLFACASLGGCVDSNGDGGTKPEEPVLSEMESDLSCEDTCCVRTMGCDWCRTCTESGCYYWRACGD